MRDGYLPPLHSHTHGMPDGTAPGQPIGGEGSIMSVVLIATVTFNFFFFFFPLTDCPTDTAIPLASGAGTPPSIHLTASIFLPTVHRNPVFAEFFSHETLCLPRHCPLETPSAPQVNCRERPGHSPNSIREIAAPKPFVHSRRDHECQFTEGVSYTAWRISRDSRKFAH